MWWVAVANEVRREEGPQAQGENGTERKLKVPREENSNLEVGGVE